MRATLRKYERLNSKKRIESLFSEGISLTAYPVRVVFLYNQTLALAQHRVQVLFSIPGRNFRKATQRNLLRRRLREAYRRNKHILNASTEQLSGTLSLAFVFTAKQQESFTIIEKSVIKLMHEINQRMLHLIEKSLK